MVVLSCSVWAFFHLIYTQMMSWIKKKKKIWEFSYNFFTTQLWYFKVPSWCQLYKVIYHFWWLVTGGAKRWNRPFPISLRGLGTNLSFSAISRSRGIGFIASGATGRNGGVAELSEANPESRLYSWPDNKVELVAYYANL